MQIGDDQEQYANVFEAILAAFPTADSTEAQTAAKQASIVAAGCSLRGMTGPRQQTPLRTA